MTVLLTRPRPDSERIAAELGKRGVETLIWPLSRIVRLTDRVDVPTETGALLFTSANGVRAFADLSPTRALPALCVGGRTASAAQEAGFSQVLDADGDAAALLGIAQASAHDHLFYPRGRETSVDLAAGLRAMGKSVHEAVLYGSDAAGPPEPAVAHAFSTGRIMVMTLWSQRNGQILANHLVGHPEWQTAHMDLVSISDNAAQAVLKAGFRRILVSSRPNATEMIETIVAALRQ